MTAATVATATTFAAAPTAADPMVAPDIVHVWLIHEKLPSPAIEELFTMLDEEEQRRAKAFTEPEDRRRFILAHGAVRCVVAEQLGAPAKDLRWRRGRHGKPELTGAWTGVQANLSHSEGLSMVAVTGSRRVGADVQRLAPEQGAAAMANRYFPAEEARFVRAARGKHNQAARFARLWARKEALVKAAGGRLTQGLPVSVQGSGGVVRDYPDKAAPGTYRITDVPAPHGFRAAVALSGDQDYMLIQSWWNWTGTA